jgi:hypothetical protein
MRSRAEWREAECDLEPKEILPQSIGTDSPDEREKSVPKINKNVLTEQLTSSPEEQVLAQEGSGPLKTPLAASQLEENEQMDHHIDLQLCFFDYGSLTE